MTARRQDAIESAIEAALSPGRFIDHRSGFAWVSGLEEVKSRIDPLLSSDPGRAVRLHETFLAGCHEKANEVDDSSGNLGTFVADLYDGWIRARQAAGADPDETARWLLARMDDDTYGFAHDMERHALEVMSKAGLAAFERGVKERFESAVAARAAAAVAGSGESSQRDAAYAVRRWADVLRAVYAARRDVAAYVRTCEETELSSKDCLRVATMLRSARKPEQALAWVKRGLAMDERRPIDSLAVHDLATMKRELLAKLGRGADALAEAWAAFQEHPGEATYEELMRYVPRVERAKWHAKTMKAAESGNLELVIGLLLETKEIGRLAARLRAATDDALEGLSHYSTEPVAKRLIKSHPDVAAKVYRALAMRILDAKKSKHYSVALAHLENAKRCYERAGLAATWGVVVAEVRGSHHRKVAFMAGFEQLVAGRGPRDEPSFLERARRRWAPRGSA